MIFFALAVIGALLIGSIVGGILHTATQIIIIRRGATVEKEGGTPNKWKSTLRK